MILWNFSLFLVLLINNAVIFGKSEFVFSFSTAAAVESLNPQTSPTQAPTFLSSTTFPTSEYDALQDIYHAAYGNYWTWGATAQQDVVPWNFSSTGQNKNPCIERWEGLSCSCTTTNCTVVGLNLNYHNLSGSISSSVSQLVNLQHLNLNNNDLHGTLPATIGQLQCLETLSLSNNSINSTIPASYAALSNLTFVHLSLNRLIGPIPTFIGEWTKLTELDFAENFMRGTIPESINELVCLQGLWLAGNYFSGSIPSQYVNSLQNLSVLDVARNELTGPIPVLSSMNMPNLTQLSLQTNHFTGILYEEIGYFKSLAILELNDNLLTGTLPSSLQNLSNLHTFTCSENHMHGPLDVLFTSHTSIRNIFVGNNYFTGLMFPANRSSATYRTLVSYQCYSNFLDGTLPAVTQNSTDFNFLSYLDVGHNYILGTIPLWFGKLSRLRYLYLNYNLLSGTIPAILGSIKPIVELYLQHNGFTGTIPFELGKLSFLREFKAHFNNLVGSIPNSFVDLHDLTVLVLNGNSFTGSLPSFAPPQPIQVLDVSSNQLTGTIPYQSIFSMQTLVTVVLSDNCFHGPISKDICQSSALFNLVLNGLGTADKCSFKMFPGVPYFTSFAAPPNSAGPFPSCILEMPDLAGVYISGNQLTGKLPDDDSIQISSSLLVLSLSYNIMTGTIPLWAQQRTWTTLDLSNNKFTGVLSNSISPVPTDGYLSLDVNRLSGSVPSSLFPAQNISILSGNIYSCDIDKSDLPQSDSYYNKYSCGTLSVDISIYGWIFGIMVIALIKTSLISWLSKHSFLERTQQLANSTPLYDTKAKLTLWQHRRKAFHYVQITIQQTLNNWVFNEASKEVRHFDSIRNILLFFSSVRYIFSAITLFTLFFLMPIYGMMSIWFSMYTFSYGWTISSILVSGDVASGLLMLGFSLCTLLVLNIFYKKAYIFSGRKKIDQRRISRSLSQHSHSVSDVLSDRQSSEVERSNDYTSMSILGVLNFIMMILVDVVYVVSILDANTTETLRLQIVLSIIKVLWNEYVLWSSYPCIKMLVNVLMQKLKYKVNHEVEVEFENTPSTWRFSLSALFNSVTKYQFTASEITFMALTVVLNNIIIPCMSVAIVSPHCYYYAFFAQSPSETVAIHSCLFYAIREESARIKRDCLVYSNYFYDISYNAPFHYRYECSAAFSIRFVSVYIFMFIIVGVILPLFHVVLQFIYSACSPEKKNLGPCSAVQNALFEIANLLLPIRWKALIPQMPQNGVRLLSLDRLIVRCSSYLGVLLAFGVLYPPLAVVALISIYAITYTEQFAISRLLTESKGLGYVWYQEKILKECEYIAESWFDTLKIILPFASFSYAFVVFDTLGDKYGWKVAMGPSIFVFSLPFWFYLWRRVIIHPMWPPQLCAKNPDSIANERLANEYEDLFVVLIQNLYSFSGCNNEVDESSNSHMVNLEMTSLDSVKPEHIHVTHNPVHSKKMMIR